MSRLSYGSLFSGGGLADLGLEAAGLQCQWQVENEPYCVRLLEQRFPGARRWGDVRTFEPDESYRVRLIVGGDPCQGNSNAGCIYKRVHEDFAVHFLRVVATLRPQFVLRENPSRIRPDAQWPWWRFRAGLESLGYGVLPFRLRACCVGADHERERLFLLAELPNANGERLEGINGEGFSPRHAGGEDSNRTWGGADLHAAPRACRGADGVSDVMERLQLLGNGWDVRVAYRIGRWLMESLCV